jgi:enamine deaminase RidA (YjgF/YER057c/UK114 family)
VLADRGKQSDAIDINGEPPRRMLRRLQPGERRMAIERFNEDELMSKYVIHNGTVYMSGQVADDPSQDFEGQLTQILAKLDAQFAKIGIDRTHMLSVMVWIDDYRKWGRLNAIWTKWVPAGHKPARSCVEAKIAFPEYQVEIAVVAALKP